MKVRLDWEGDNRLTLSCSGSLGWNVQEDLVRQVAAALEDRTQPQVVIDLEHVNLITSAGLGCPLQVRKMVKAHGGRLALAHASPAILQLFNTIGLDRQIPLAGTLEDARNLAEQVN